MTEESRGDGGVEEAATLPGDPATSGARVGIEVFDAMPIGAALLSPNGTVRYANPVLSDLLGASPMALVGRHISELVEPGEVDAVTDRINDVLEGRSNAFECLLAASPAALSGLTWPIRTHVAPVFGPDGRVDGLVGQVFDFRPVAATPPLPPGLAEVLEEGSDYLLTADADGTLTYGNRAAREVLGVEVVERTAAPRRRARRRQHRDLPRGRRTEPPRRGELAGRAGLPHAGGPTAPRLRPGRRPPPRSRARPPPAT